MNHYFDADGLYTHSMPEGGGRIPRNATPWAGVWPRWNHGGRCWELVEDHRAHARTDIPALLKHIEEQRDKTARLERETEWLAKKLPIGEHDDTCADACRRWRSAARKAVEETCLKN